jgi:hypothetical protein
MIAKGPLGPRPGAAGVSFQTAATLASLEGFPRTRLVEREPGMETVNGELTDFCLVLLPNDEAVGHGCEAVRRRFAFLAEETRTELVSTVAGRVEEAVARGTGRPIVVAISIESDAIHGTVSDEEETGDGTTSRFEISLQKDG